MMQCIETALFRRQLKEWILDNKRIAIKILDLVEAITNSPFEGIGKPEPLKHELAGAWSRRIDQEHRIIYRVDSANNSVIFESCNGHYE